jgi:pre-mRNA-splicing factor CWC22
MKKETTPPPPAPAVSKGDAGKTAGIYIPPAKLRAMRQQITDKSSEEYQRMTWEALKKSLNGLINKVPCSV